MKQFFLIFFASICLLINTEYIHAQLHYNDSVNTSIDTPADSLNEELISRYEAMLDEMALILKEAMTGDPDAEQKYTIWQEKSEPFIQSLQSHFVNFTPEQMQRINDKAEKITAEINTLSYSNADIANLKDNSSEEKEEIFSECSLILDEYEAIVEQCILLYPKVAAGEEQAIKEMQTVAEKMQAISDIMSNCSSSYSKDDTDRIQQVADKLMKVLSSYN